MSGKIIIGTGWVKIDKYEIIPPGLLAVTNYSGEWRVTHVATGHAFPIPFESKSAAMKAAKAIYRGFPKKQLLATTENEVIGKITRKQFDAMLERLLMTTPPTTISRMGRKRKEIDQSTYSGRVAARLRMLREKSGKTVPEMAKALRIPRFTYYGYENGKNPLPLTLIEPIATVLGISIRHLLPKE